MTRAKKKAADKSARAAHGLESEAIERGLERFRGMLREQGHRQSMVREAVARAALAYEGHFEVNDLVRELRQIGVEEAHTATVYRTLPLLVEAGMIQPALLTHGERQFYERSFERAHHDHLICAVCGKVVEFEFEAFEVLQRDIAARYGFELTSHVHELVGRCPDCRGAAPKPPRKQGH